MFTLRIILIGAPFFGMEKRRINATSRCSWSTGTIAEPVKQFCWMDEESCWHEQDVLQEMMMCQTDRQTGRTTHTPPPPKCPDFDSMHSSAGTTATNSQVNLPSYLHCMLCDVSSCIVNTSRETQAPDSSSSSSWWWSRLLEQHYSLLSDSSSVCVVGQENVMFFIAPSWIK